MSLSSHQSRKSKTTEWLTPPSILKALGDFDLDPCSPIVRPWPTAKKHFTIEDGGLTKNWSFRGRPYRVWLNPPFGNEAALWLAKLAWCGNGIALIPARTETKMFFASVWGKADAVCFLRGRPHFHHADGSRGKWDSGAPICLVAYGQHNAVILKASGLGYTVQAS